MGDKENALIFAQKVIDEYNWSWSSVSDINRSKIMKKEIITKLKVDKLPDYYERYFLTETYTTTDNNDEHIKVVYDVLKSDYVSSGDGVNDYRYLYQFTYNTENVKALSSKYDITSDLDRGIPLFRMGEMYLIAAESSLPDKVKAVEYLNELRLHRGIVNEVSSDLEESDILNQIVRETRKELYLEGQTFFAYKRLNKTSIPMLDRWLPFVSVEEDIYNLPKPQNEIDLGNL